MKKLLFALLLGASAVSAQKQEPYQFKEVKRATATPVKSQDQTGTCWSFSTASFLESELLRMGKAEQNLSEMFVVRNIYRQKAENYVRRQGHAQFGEGGLAHDLLNAVERYGIVPETVYPGRKDPAKPYSHSALAKNLKSLLDGFVQQGQRGQLPTNWLTRVDSLLDAELGVVPLQFTYNNTVFTPVSFRDYLGIDPKQYVTVTSFTHQPFYQPFVLEIPDNWANGTFYNLPINELVRVANYALDRGYTLTWDADVSNPGFAAGKGLAIVPERSWDSKDATAQTNTFKYWEPEKQITQAYRQQLFDSQETTDDHLMHVVGVLDEAHSGLYYVVKNSWGEISDLKGYVYVSDAYLRQNTISFTVHRDVLPEDIQRRLDFLPGESGVIKPTPVPSPDIPKQAPQTPVNKKTPSNKPRLDRQQLEKARKEASDDRNQ